MIINSCIITSNIHRRLDSYLTLTLKRCTRASPICDDISSTLSYGMHIPYWWRVSINWRFLVLANNNSPTYITKGVSWSLECLWTAVAPFLGDWWQLYGIICAGAGSNLVVSFSICDCMSGPCSIILMSSMRDGGTVVSWQFSSNTPSNCMLLSRISLRTSSAAFEVCSASSNSKAFDKDDLTSSLKASRESRSFYGLVTQVSEQEALPGVECSLDFFEPSCSSLCHQISQIGQSKDTPSFTASLCCRYKSNKFCKRLIICMYVLFVLSLLS